MDHCRPDPVHRLKGSVDPALTELVRVTLTDEPGLQARDGSHSVQQVEKRLEVPSRRRNWPVSILADELGGHASDPHTQVPREEPSLGLAKGLGEQEDPGRHGPLGFEDIPREQIICLLLLFSMSRK